MATVTQAIALQDRMSPVLVSITGAMRQTMNVMEQLNTVTGRAVPASSFTNAADAIAQAETQVNGLIGGIAQVGQTSAAAGTATGQGMGAVTQAARGAADETDRVGAAIQRISAVMTQAAADSKVLSALSSQWDGVRNVASSAINQVLWKIDDMKAGFSSAMSNVSQRAANASTAMAQKFSSAVSTALARAKAIPAIGKSWDKVKSASTKMAQAAQKGMNKVSSGCKEVKSIGTVVAGSIAKGALQMVSSLGKVGSGALKAAGTLKSGFMSACSAAKSGVSSIAGAAKSAFSAVSGAVSKVASIASSVGGAIKGVFDKLGGMDFEGAYSYIDGMDKMQNSLTRLTGDSEASKAALTDMENATKGTAYSFDTTSKAMQNLVANGAGLDAASGQTRVWMDAVAAYGDGTNEQLESVTGALGEMLSAGSVSMDQLETLNAAGINGVEMYALATQQSAEEVAAQVQSGKLGAADFMNTVAGAMATGANGVQSVTDAAQEAGATWENTFTSYQESLTRGTAGFLTNIESTIASAGAPSIQSLIGDVGTQMEMLFAELGTTLGPAIAQLPPMLQEMIPQIFGLAQSLLPLITQILPILQPLLQIVFEILMMIMEPLIGIVGQILPILVELILMIMPLVQQLIEAAWLLLEPILQLIPVLLEALMPLIEMVIDAVSRLLEPLMAILTPIINIIVMLVDFLIPIFELLIEAIQPIIDIVVLLVELFATLLEPVLQLIKKILDPIFEVLKKCLEPVLQVIKSVFEAVAGAVQQAIDWLQSLIGWLLEMMGIESSDPSAPAGDSNGAANTAKDGAEDKNKFKFDKDKFSIEPKKPSGNGAVKSAAGGSPYLPSAGGSSALGGTTNPVNTTSTGGNLDTVQEVASVNEVGGMEEELKYLKDIARTEYVNQYTTMRPVVTANFGDVHESADTNQIISVLESAVAGVYNSSMVRG